MEVLILKGFEVNKERAEILAPSRTEAFLDRFCAETGIAGECGIRGKDLANRGNRIFRPTQRGEKDKEPRNRADCCRLFDDRSRRRIQSFVSATGFGDGVRGNGENLMATAATKARPP